MLPYNADNIDVSKAAFDNFDATASYTTPSYNSMDVARSVTLMYRSRHARPVVTIEVDASDNSGSPPDKMSIRLQKPDGSWVTFLNGAQEIYYYSGAGTTRLAAPFDASALTTGFYSGYRVVVRSWWGGSYQESSEYIRVMVVNESSSPLGAGWSVAGLQKMHFGASGNLIITDGSGSAAYFALQSCDPNQYCSYTSPPGDFTVLYKITEWDCDEGNCTIAYVWYSRAYPDGSWIYFDASGRMISTRDQNSVIQTTFGYNGAGKLTTITDKAGKVTTFSYSATTGKLTSISDPTGRISYFNVNGSGDLTSITDPASVTAFQATYNAQHRMLTRTDRRGGVYGFAYAYSGALSADTLPTIVADGSSVRPVTTFRSPQDSILGSVAAGYGSFSSPAARITPAAARGRVTNARGYSTYYSLDRFGAPVQIEEPLGRTTQIVRNQHSQDTLVTAPSGQRTRLTWNGSVPTSVTDQSTGKTITIQYGTWARITQIYGDTDSLWNYWSSAGRLDSTRTGKRTNAVAKFTYNSSGRLLTARDPGGHLTTFYFPTTGYQNTDSVKDSYRRTAYTYDSYTRISTIKDPKNNVRAYSYDLINRIIRSIGPLNDTTHYAYDGLYLTSVTDAKSQNYSLSPNALGWIQTRTDPSWTRQDQYKYDRNGNLKEWINRRGQSITFTYNELDQLSSRTADGATATYYHDPADRMVAAANAESIDTLRYDSAGRPTHQVTVRSGTNFALVSAYNTLDLRQSLTYLKNGSSVRSHTFTYAEKSILKTFTGLDGNTTTINYTAERLAEQFALPASGLTVTRTFPSTHRASSIAYNNSTIDAKFGLKYQYDDLARPFERANMAGDSIRQFQRQVGRLAGFRDYYDGDPSNCTSNDPDRGFTCTGTGRTLLYSDTFTYDLVGNRTDQSATFDTGNRLTSFDGYTMTYDADGNMVTKSKSGVISQQLYWNSLSQLDSVITGGTVVRFGYDAFGRRVRKSTNSATIRYVYDDDDIFLEADGSGNVTVEYMYYPGTDRPHSMRRAGDSNIYYFTTDVPGNVTGVVSDGLTIMNSYRYRPFGAVEDSTQAVANTLRYMARQYDGETRLYYMRARYYDPALARFVSEDPIGLDGGINVYAFAVNDPVSFRDPSGLGPECKEMKEAKDDVKIECTLGPIENDDGPPMIVIIEAEPPPPPLTEGGDIGGVLAGPPKKQKGNSQKRGAVDKFLACYDKSQASDVVMVTSGLGSGAQVASADLFSKASDAARQANSPGMFAGDAYWLDRWVERHNDMARKSIKLERRGRIANRAGLVLIAAGGVYSSGAVVVCGVGSVIR